MESVDTLKNLINKRKYKEAEALAKELGKFNELIDLLSNNRHAKQATLILKKNNIALEEYPELLDRLRKRYVRYITETTPFEQAEVRLLSNKHCLTILAEDLCYKKQVNESLSIIKRHELETYIVKKEVLELLGSDFEYVENAYLAKDGFGILTSAHGRF